MTNNEVPVCLNCQSALSGDFCSECGQRANVKRLSIRSFLREIPYALLNVESRYWNTIKGFFTNPSTVVSEFVQGRRRYYAPPIQFYYFFATLSVFIAFLFGIDSPDIVVKDAGEYNEFQHRLIRAGYIFEIIIDDYIQFFELLIPLSFGVWLKLFFYSKLKIADAFVFAFYGTAIAMELAGIPTIFIEHWVNTSELDMIVTGLLIFYFSSFISKVRWWSGIKGISAYLASIVFIMIVIMVILFILEPWL